MKKAIAKCSHEDAPELSLPPYRSAYRFTNTMINKGDDYEHINDMATMFAKMMHHMKNRNAFSPYSAMSSNSHHGDSKMDTMQMMKMKNMMRDNDHTYSSSSYNSTPCASRGPLETTSILETGSSRSWPSRSTRWRPRSQHDLRHEGVERPGRQQQH